MVLGNAAKLMSKRRHVLKGHEKFHQQNAGRADGFVERMRAQLGDTLQKKMNADVGGIDGSPKFLKRSKVLCKKAFNCTAPNFLVQAVVTALPGLVMGVAVWFWAPSPGPIARHKKTSMGAFYGWSFLLLYLVLGFFPLFFCYFSTSGSTWRTMMWTTGTGSPQRAMQQRATAAALQKKVQKYRQGFLYSLPLVFLSLPFQLWFLAYCFANSSARAVIGVQSHTTMPNDVKPHPSCKWDNRWCMVYMNLGEDELVPQLTEGTTSYNDVTTTPEGARLVDDAISTIADWSIVGLAGGCPPSADDVAQPKRGPETGITLIGPQLGSVPPVSHFNFPVPANTYGFPRNNAAGTFPDNGGNEPPRRVHPFDEDDDSTMSFANFAHSSDLKALPPGLLREARNSTHSLFTEPVSGQQFSHDSYEFQTQLLWCHPGPHQIPDERQATISGVADLPFVGPFIEWGERSYELMMDTFSGAQGAFVAGVQVFAGLYNPTVGRPEHQGQPQPTSNRRQLRKLSQQTFSEPADVAKLMVLRQGYTEAQWNAMGAVTWPNPMPEDWPYAGKWSEAGSKQVIVKSLGGVGPLANPVRQAAEALEPEGRRRLGQRELSVAAVASGVAYAASAAGVTACGVFKAALMVATAGAVAVLTGPLAIHGMMMFGPGLVATFIDAAMEGSIATQPFPSWWWSPMMEDRAQLYGLILNGHKDDAFPTSDTLCSHQSLRKAPGSGLNGTLSVVYRNVEQVASAANDVPAYRNMAFASARDGLVTGGWTLGALPVDYRQLTTQFHGGPFWDASIKAAWEGVAPGDRTRRSDYTVYTQLPKRIPRSQIVWDRDPCAKDLFSFQDGFSISLSLFDAAWSSIFGVLSGGTPELQENCWQAPVGDTWRASSWAMSDIVWSDRKLRGLVIQKSVQEMVKDTGYHANYHESWEVDAALRIKPQIVGGFFSSAGGDWVLRESFFVSQLSLYDGLLSQVPPKRRLEAVDLVGLDTWRGFWLHDDGDSRFDPPSIPFFNEPKDNAFRRVCAVVDTALDLKLDTGKDDTNIAYEVRLANCEDMWGFLTAESRFVFDDATDEMVWVSNMWTMNWNYRLALIPDWAFTEDKRVTNATDFRVGVIHKDWPLAQDWILHFQSPARRRNVWPPAEDGPAAEAGETDAFAAFMVFLVTVSAGFSVMGIKNQRDVIYGAYEVIIHIEEEEDEQDCGDDADGLEDDDGYEGHPQGEIMEQYGVW